MSEAPVIDLDACAREPIHIPGAIQPHGVMLVADRTTQEISHAAGDVTGFLGAREWIGRSLGEVLGDTLAARVAQATQSGAQGGYAGHLVGPRGAFDVSAHIDGQWLIVEVEPGLAQPLPATMVLEIGRAHV